MNKNLENYYILGRRAYENAEYDETLDFFRHILLDNPNDWEGNFYTIMCKAKKATLLDFDKVIKLMTYDVPGLFKSYNSNFKELGYREQLNAVKKIEYEITKTIIDFERAVSNFYVNNSSSSGAKSEFTGRILSLSVCCGKLGEAIENDFDDEEIQKICVQPLKNAIALFKKFLNGAPADFMISQRYNISKYDIIVKKYDPNYINPYDEAIKVAKKTNPTTNSGGCYVATCVYGSYDCPQVWTLRRYRDNFLAKTWYGRVFIRTYYAISPTLVKWFGNKNWFKKMWQGKLDRMVVNLQEQGVESTPYEDKNW